MHTLQAALLELVRALQPHGIPVILCGGLGLYLKQLELQSREKCQSLVPGEYWPVPRTTQDMDIMIQTDVLASPSQCAVLRTVLAGLGYEVIQTRRHFQFVKKQGEFFDVKIDLLTGEMSEARIETEFVIDRKSRIPRARPRGTSVDLHAWYTPEAIEVNCEDGLRLDLEDGGSDSATVNIPQALALLMMKLFALRDRYMDEDRGLARHHAMDLYRILAMMDRDEYYGTQEKIRRRRDAGCEIVAEAERFVVELFVKEPRWGWIRIREHADFRQEMPVEEVVSALVELFDLKEKATAVQK